MKVEITDNEEKGVLQFPKLRISSDGRVVLFTSKHKGTVLSDSKTYVYDVGFYSTDWDSDKFKDFIDGTINLSND